MVGVIDPARKDKLVQRAAAVFEPGQNAAAGGFEEFELNGWPLFCWTTIARDRTRPPLTMSPILTLTTSHPRNLQSIARSNIAGVA